MLLDSPNVILQGGWSHGDRTAPSSSVGSINMMGSEDSSSSSDEVDPLDPEDNDDPMIMTPQANTNTLFPGLNAGNNGVFSNLFSPGGQPNFASMHRARLRKGRSRARAQPVDTAPWQAPGRPHRQMAKIRDILREKRPCVKRVRDERAFPFLPTTSTSHLETIAVTRAVTCPKLRV